MFLNQPMVSSQICLKLTDDHRLSLSLWAREHWIIWWLISRWTPIEQAHYPENSRSPVRSTDAFLLPDLMARSQSWCLHNSVIFSVQKPHFQPKACCAMRADSASTIWL